LGGSKACLATLAWKRVELQERGKRRLRTGNKIGCKGNLGGRIAPLKEEEKRKGAGPYLEILRGERRGGGGENKLQK